MILFRTKVKGVQFRCNSNTRYNHPLFFIKSTQSTLSQVDPPPMYLCTCLPAFLATRPVFDLSWYFSRYMVWLIGNNWTWGLAQQREFLKSFMLFFQCQIFLIDESGIIPRLANKMKCQPSGAEGTRSPHATPHRLQHLTARLIQNGLAGLEKG